jgi:hypothetical protein
MIPPIGLVSSTPGIIFGSKLCQKMEARGKYKGSVDYNSDIYSITDVTTEGVFYIYTRAQLHHDASRNT